VSDFLLPAWKICEFVDRCKEMDCIGRTIRPGPVSCALRRLFLACEPKNDQEVTSQKEC